MAMKNENPLQFIACVCVCVVTCHTLELSSAAWTRALCVCMCVYRVWQQLFATLLPRRLMCRRLTAVTVEAAGRQQSIICSQQPLKDISTLVALYIYIFHRDFHWLDTCRYNIHPFPLPHPFFPCGHLGFLWKYFETFCGSSVCLRFKATTTERACYECKVFSC